MATFHRFFGNLRAAVGRRFSAIAALALVAAVSAALLGGSVTIFGPRTLVRTTGAPNIFTFTFSPGSAAAPYLLHIDNHGVTSAVVTLNGVQILGPSDFKAAKSEDWKKPADWDDNDWDERSSKDKSTDDDWRKDHDWKAEIERTVRLGASNTLRVELRSKPGTHLSIRITAASAAVPTITAVATPTANAAGWNRTDVQVAFTCDGGGSPIASCTPAVLVTTEGRGQVITGRAVNTSGGSATTSVTLNIDKTAPAINGAVQPAPNEFGWVNEDATVSFVCADALSGVASCSAPVRVSTEGGNQAIRGAATDVAGNTAIASVVVSLDKTAPVITAAVSPAPNAQGWNRGDVTVTFSCTDGNSGIGSCPAPVTMTTEGAGQQISGTARDRAGNTASTSVTVNIDKTVPVITVSPLPAANANGWNNSDVTVSFTCSDAGAGVASCPGPVTLIGEGAQQLISREVTDNAGNTATASAVISIDKTAPTISAAALPPPNALGWSDTNVTVTFTCADTLSGIDSCQPPVTAPEGAQQTVSGAAVDKAGNRATAAITLNVDKTPVSIQADVQPPPNAAGWNNTNATVTFVCQDTGSGVGSCPPPVSVTLEGAGQVISGTGSDRAGNRSTASVTVNLDKTPPQVAAAVTPAPNANGWISRSASVAFVCSDPGGSGVASCPSPTTVGEGAGQQIAGTALDVAGNSATAGVAVSVDLTPPTIVASISPPPSADGWITQDATVTFTCSDGGSGIATCPAPVTLTSDGANQVVSGAAIDRAGNTAAASVTLNILKTPPSIAATVDPPPNADGWNRTNVVVTFTCAGSSASFCPAPVTVASEGAGQVVTRRITNAAGASAEASVTLNIDKSGPTISAVATPGPNAAGWSRADVTVSFTCGDGLSGVVSCPTPTTVSAETAGVTIGGTAVDRAGNSSTASALVKIDRTPPVVTISSPAPGATLLSSPAALTGVATDALSGIVSTTCNGAPANVGPGGALSCGPTLAPGDNALTLTATDAAGNTAAPQVSVTYALNHPPIADAGLGQSGIVGTPLAFSGAGSKDPDDDAMSFAWSFGDGASASGLSTSHSYSSAGVYTVTLTVTDAKGASGAATTAATIVAANHAPVANAGGGYSGIAGALIAFAGSGSDPDTDPLVSTWSFGDGSFASGLTASHAYAAAGTYTVTLTISDGQVSTTSTTTAQVAGVNHRPVVSLAMGQYSGTTGTPVTFSATASDPDNDALTVSWNFGDGGAGDGSAPSHTFASPGTFTVTVTATDTHGETALASASAVIVQANRAPHASANGPYAGQARSRITFSAAGATDADNDTLTYSWDFGDGSTGTGLAPNHAYASEGTYTAKVTVDDHRGGHDSATAAVQVAPAPVLVNRPPIARPGGPYTGQSGVVLTLNGSASTDPDNDALTFSWNFGDGSAGSGPAPAHVYATDGAFQVTLTVDDAHGHSTTAVTSATLAPASDRAPPSVTLSAPSKVLPGTAATITATATDNVGVASVTFDVDGVVTTLTAPPFQRIVNVPAVAAPGAQILVRADVADAAGNVGTAQMALTIDAAPDTENPNVVLNAPAEATPGSTIRLTATATDNVGVASVAFTAEGSPLATVPAAPYESVYTVSANAVAGSTLTFGARAVDFTGNRADAAATVSIVSQHDTTAPAVTVAAPAGVAPGASLAISANATDDGGVASVSLSVDGVEIARVAQAPYGATYHVPAGAAPGSILHVEARASDFSGNEGRAAAETAVVLAESGLAIGEVYDDTTGLLLPEAAVSLVGADASGAPYAETTQSDGRGRFVLRGAAGHGVITITGVGLTRVDRPVTLRNGTVVEVLDSRLTPLAAPAPAVSGVLGGTMSVDGNVLTVAAGAGIGSTPLAVTTVSPRGLGGPLPLGWSPVSVLDIAPHGAPIVGSTLSAPNALHLPAGAPLVLARWDETAAAWRAAGDASVSSDASALQGSVDVTGQFAILLADTQPSAPPHPGAGELVAGVPAVQLPPDAMSLVTARPKIIFYSPGVKSEVTGVLTSVSPAPSGTVIWSRITESYQFFSGAEIHPDSYTSDIVFYQVANDATRQRAAYTVSPSLTFEPLSLKSGVITVALFAPPVSPAPIATVSSIGGALTAATGESIQVPPGAASDTLPLQISGLSATELGVSMPDGVDFIGAMRLDFSGTLALPAIASVPAPASLTDSTGILLVRLQELEGQTRLVLVGVGRVAGDRVVSDVSLGSAADAFEGVRVAGRYAFVHMQALTAFAAGAVFGAGNTPFAGGLVSTPTLPIVSLSRGAAGYVAVGAVGLAAFSAKDLLRADLATASVTFTAQDEVQPLDLHLVAQPPTVASFVPSEGSTSVALATAVVVTFSKPIDPATLAGASAGNITLAAGDGTVVAATLSLSARNSMATLRPVAPLQPNTVYTVTVAAAIADASGNRLGAAASAKFTSLDTVPPLPPPAGAVTASIPVNGASTVTGTQGTGGAHDQVTIVNLATGQVTPVLLDPNGGFSTTIAASPKDTLRLKIVDPAGNQTTLDLPRFSQSNPDGSLSTAVGAEGGHITGPGDTAVDVSPGTFPDGAVVTIKPVSEAEFPVSLTAEQKTVLAYAGGVRLDFGGATPTKYVNVSVPAGPNDKPDDQWVVSAATEINGQMVMNVVDTAKLIGGRIETSSPPCPGVTGAAVYGVHKSLRPFGLNYGQMYASGYGGVQVQVDFVPVGFVLLPFLSWTPSLPAPICLPVLAGSVSIGLNAQRVTIPASALSPADREVVVTSEDGDGNPADSHFPKSSVRYAFEVLGKDTDAYTVVAVTASGTPPAPVPNVRITRSTASSVLVAFSPDVLTAPGLTKIVVSNTTTGAQAEFPQQQIAYVVSAPGGAGSVSRVRVIDANGAVRDIQNFTTSSPTGTERLMAHAVRGTIDPTWDQLDQLPPEKVPFGARGVVDVTVNQYSASGAQIVHVPPSARVDGSFSVGINGLLSNTFTVSETYADRNGDNPRTDSINIPTFHVQVTNPVSGQLLRSYVIRVPGINDQINLGSLTDDTQPPYLVASPPQPQNFDPGTPLSFTFSKAMNASSIQLNLAVSANGVAVSGRWQMSGGNRVATFIPDAPLHIGETYTVTFNGTDPTAPTPTYTNPSWITDVAGNPIAKKVVTIKTFLPHLVKHFRVDDDDFTFAAAPRDMAFRDVAVRRRRLANNTLSTTLVTVTGSDHGSKVMTIDATDPTAPSVVGRAGGSNTKQRVMLLPDIGIGGAPALTLREPTGCDPASASQTFTGDMAVTTSFNSYFSIISFFDVTPNRPMAPCLLSNKILTVEPDRVTGLSQHGTVKAPGYARAVGAISTTKGFEAYVAVGQVGAMAVDVAGNIPEVLPDNRKLEGLYSADYRDLAMFNDRIVAGDQSGNRLDLLDANLTLLSSLDMGGGPRRVTVAPGFGADENDDGSITRSEIHDLAVVGEDVPGGDSLIEFVDISDVRALQSLGTMPIPGLVRDIKVDVERRRAFVATFGNSGNKLYVVDINHLGRPGILWSVPVPSAQYGLTLDIERGLLYDSTDAGIDIWAVYDNCCDLAVDMAPKPAPDPVGDRDELVRREKAALQKGIAAGLAAAAVSCSGQGGITAITILEQGSGACLWQPDPVSPQPNEPKTACGRNPNYQPGLSDHDFEVFLPTAVNRCVTDKLTEQFKDALTGDRKPIEVRPGVKMTFDDISFFPVSKAAFESGKLDLSLPPPGGDDPYGDHGLGRQQLLLKWLLEGEYIDVPGYPLTGADQNAILKSVKVPALEGYEWSVLQENAFASSKAFVRIRGAADPGMSMHKLFVKQLHSVGKAAIRAALARMVANDAARARILTGLDRDSYRRDGCIAVNPLSNDPETWKTTPCGSFEEWVASSAALTVRGARLPLFSVPDVQQIHRFYRVKADREHIVDENVADKFLLGAAKFIDIAKTATKAAFDLGTMGPGAGPDAPTRLANVARVVQFTHGTRTATKIPLVPHVSNRGFITAQDVEVALWTEVTPGAGTKGPAVRDTLAGGDDHWLDYKRGADGKLILDSSGKPQPIFTLGPIDTLTDTATHGVAFTIDLEEHKVKEAYRQNNFGGFYYYVLGNTPGPGFSPPAPLPADKLAPDQACYDAPLVEITQAILVNGAPQRDLATVGFGAKVTVRITVRNLSAVTQTGIRVNSSFTNQEYGFPDLLPTQEAHIDILYKAPVGQSVVIDGTATVNSDSLGVVTSPPTRIVSVPSLYALAPADRLVNPDCLPAAADCKYPSQIMQGGRAFRYFRVIDTTTLDKVPNAEVITKTTGPSVSGQLDTFTTDADGIVGTPTEPGMPISYTPQMEGDYTVMPVSVNGSPMTAPDLKPLYIVTSKPLEYMQGLKAGASMSIGGKILGGEGTLGIGGGLSLGLLVAKKPTPLFKTLTIGRTMDAKASLAFKPDTFKFNVNAGFNIKAEGPSASDTLGVGVQIGDKYLFPTFPLTSEDSLRLAGLAIDTATRATTIGLPGGPIFGHILAAINDKVTNFGDRKISDSANLSISNAVGLTVFRLHGGFGGGGGGLNDYTQEYRASFGVEGSGKVTGTIGAERLVQANQLVASAGITGEASATAGLNLGSTREAAVSTGNFQELEFVKNEIKAMLSFSAGISGGLKYGLTLDSANSYNPVKIDISFSGKKNFGWSISGSSTTTNSTPGQNDFSSIAANLGNGDQFTRTYTVTDPDTILPMLSTTANIAMLLPQGFSGVVLDPAGSFGFTPTNMYDQLVDLIALLGRNSTYVDAIEKGNGIKLPIGFDVSVLAEGAKAGVEIGADHTLGFTLAKGVLKNHSHYKLEDYPNNLMSLNSASDVLSLYSDALSNTSSTSDTFRDVQKTPPSNGASGSIKSNGSAEIRPANQSDYEAVTGLLSFDFGAIPGPVRTRPYRPADVFGPADKPHYGLGGFHQLVPFEQTLAAPAPLILDYHDAELVAGVDKSSIALYRWNKDRSDWDPVPATADPATNTVRTTVTKLGLFTLGPAMPAGDISWSVESTTDLDRDTPQARRHVVFVSNPMTMNNGSAVPAGAMYHVISTSAAASMENYTFVGTVTTPDLRPDLDGAQISVGADGRLRIEVDYPAGIGRVQLITFSDVGTAYGSPVLSVVQQ